MTAYKFEEGKTYGNWISSIERTVIKRTPCYVTFKGGLRKKVETVKLDKETATEIIKFPVKEFNVYAAAER